MAGQMKVGLIGESVTMHYLDYYCETHKDRIAGFSDVRDDKNIRKTTLTSLYTGRTVLHSRWKPRLTPTKLGMYSSKQR